MTEIKRPKWEISNLVIKETEEALRSKESEVFVLWVGPIKKPKDKNVVTSGLVPFQDTHRGTEGNYVHVSGDELRRIAFANYERDERSVAQVHSHPGKNTTISSLDRRWAVADHQGALSIIVPDYGKNGMRDLFGLSIYEKEGSNWRLWNKRETKRRFRMVS
ncbi:MAG: hypothetical protein OK439_00315 [Thaumarchaeota archaeon]|nr:hypothetical protein [Nitrososphaerota archaeon]